jgi:acyl carrier protein
MESVGWPPDRVAKIVESAGLAETFDSFELTEMYLVVESAFDCDLPAELYESLQTVGDLVGWIASRSV